MTERTAGAGDPPECLPELVAAWSRVGAGFNVEPATETPDLEALIVETARAGRWNARLYLMAATWLARYGSMVARHRLRRMAAERLGPPGRAALGLMLDAVRQVSGTRHFNDVISDCQPLARAEPLFHVHRSSPALTERILGRASAVSRAWNLIAEPFALNPDALRAPAWVVSHNARFDRRADYQGDLRCSVVEELAHDPDAGSSELELARRCGATRAAIRQALDRLELAGRINRHRVGRRNAIRLVG